MRLSRKQIRDNVRQRLVDWFDKQSGGTLPRIRGFESGQWQPGNRMLPCITVSGAGQQRAASAADTESEKTLSYDLEILLELQENWDNGDRFDEWESFVQEMIEALWNWLPDAGVMRFEYEADENPDVQLTYGPSAAMWVIRFRCDYCVYVGPVGRDD